MKQYWSKNSLQSATEFELHQPGTPPSDSKQAFLENPSKE